MHHEHHVPAKADRDYREPERPGCYPAEFNVNDSGAPDAPSGSQPGEQTPPGGRGRFGKRDVEHVAPLPAELADHLRADMRDAASGWPGDQHLGSGHQQPPLMASRPSERR